MSWIAPDLTRRVPGPELMDDVDGIGGAELTETLGQLRVINRWLGGHATTVVGLDDLLTRDALRGVAERGGALTVADVGGGTGDVAETILAWGRRRGVQVDVTVIDVHAETVAIAAERLRDVPGARAEVGDLFALPEDAYDVVHAALFLHHFDGDRAAAALSAMARAARCGVVVNDLRRGRVPWVLIRVLTGVFSRNRLIRHDAPLSVARAFRAEDWERLGLASALALRWCPTWAWRWAVSGVPREGER